MLRNSKDLTTIQLSKELDIEYTMLVKLETNKYNPNLHHITAIAKYFNVTIDDLLTKKPKIVFE